jgi:hypothetical protein
MSLPRLTPTQTGKPPARHEQARALFERYLCKLRKAGASLRTSAERLMPADEPLPIHSGRRSREIMQILWLAEQTLVVRASCEKDRADIDAQPPL